MQEGAAKFGNVECCRIVGDDIVSGRLQNNKLLSVVDAADGVIFGSPTYMGGPAAQFKAFADATSDRWNELSAMAECLQPRAKIGQVVEFQ